MSRCGFFNGVTHRIDKWMGHLFVLKKVSPSELKQMDYPELKYWFGWVELESKELDRQRRELDAVKKVR